MVSSRPNIGISLLDKPLSRSDLQPSASLLPIFEECHNHVYANDGFLKDRIFNEFVKLLTAKLEDEANNGAPVAFYVTRNEYDAAMRDDAAALRKRVSELVERAAERHPTLFGDDRRLQLSDSSLAYVIARLQGVSLNDSPADAKGEAFQTFLYRHQRGDRGEFFTPQPMVRLAVEVLDPQPNDVVLDPATGSGGFLIESLRHVLRNHPRVRREHYVRDRLRGIEFNPDVARAAMLRLVMEGGSGNEIRSADALAAPALSIGPVDIVLTNPPFGTKGKVHSQAILEQFDLARRWVRSDVTWRKTAESVGSQTPEILFIERSLRLLRPGGRMAIVVPDGLLHNSSVGHVRTWIRQNAHVLGVVSVPSETFIPYGTGIKTSLLFLRRLPANAPSRVFFGQVQRIGYDVKGKPTRDSDVERVARYANATLSGDELSERGQFALASSDVNDRLDVEHYLPSDLGLIDELAAVGAKPLGEIAEIVRKRDNFRQAGGEFRYIAISDIDTRLLAVSNQQVMDVADAPSRATYRLVEGDIVTAISGASTGTPKHAVALIGDDEAGAICSNGLAVVRNVAGLHPYFLAAYMRSPAFLRQVRRFMTGHAIPAISLDDLERVLVPLPSKDVETVVVTEIARLVALRADAVRIGLSVGQSVQQAVGIESDHVSSADGSPSASAAAASSA